VTELILFPAISSVLTLFLGFLISEVQNKVGLLTLSLGLVVFLLTYGMTLLVVTLQWRPVSIGLFEEISARLTNLIDKNAIGVVDVSELVRQEKASRHPEIWLVTGDLAEDVVGGPFFAVVEKNLKKGMRYVYFCPQSVRNEGRCQSIQEAHGKTGAIRIAFLPDDFFFLTPKLDFTIFDPFNKTGTRVGYMGLPMDHERHLHCPMDQELLDSLVGRLNKIAQKEG
jgi:hypothetical protein